MLGFVGTATRCVMVGNQAPTINVRTMLVNGSFQLGFDFAAGANFTVLATTNLALPLANWTTLG